MCTTTSRKKGNPGWVEAKKGKQDLSLLGSVRCLILTKLTLKALHVTAFVYARLFCHDLVSLWLGGLFVCFFICLFPSITYVNWASMLKF